MSGEKFHCDVWKLVFTIIISKANNLIVPNGRRSRICEFCLCINERAIRFDMNFSLNNNIKLIVEMCTYVCKFIIKL